MISQETLQVTARLEALSAKVESLSLRVQKLEREKIQSNLVINNLRSKVTRYGKTLVLLHDTILPILEETQEKKLPTLEEACFLHSVCTR